MVRSKWQYVYGSHSQINGSIIRPTVIIGDIGLSWMKNGFRTIQERFRRLIRNPKALLNGGTFLRVEQLWGQPLTDTRKWPRIFIPSLIFLFLDSTPPQRWPHRMIVVSFTKMHHFYSIFVSHSYSINASFFCSIYCFHLSFPPV